MGATGAMATYLSGTIHQRILKWVLVYEEWMDKDG